VLYLEDAVLVHQIIERCIERVHQPEHLGRRGARGHAREPHHIAEDEDDVVKQDHICC
jgi:hypothetical protein